MTLPLSSPPAGKTLLRWQARDWIPNEKDLFRRALLLAGVLAGAGFTAWQGIWSGVVGCAALLLAILFHREEEPELREVEVTELGVRWGKNFWQHAAIRKFWIDFRPGLARQFCFEATGRWLPRRVTIELEGINPLDLREALRGKLPEIDPQPESILAKVSRFFRL